MIFLRKRKNSGKKSKNIKGIALTIILVFAVTLVLSVIIIGDYIKKNVDTSLEEILLAAQNKGAPTRLYTLSENGEMKECEGAVLNISGSREYASYEEIPKNLIYAFVAIEDKRFFEHKGIDLITTVKAIFKYLKSDGRSPGGSTITQQLIKNLSGDDDYTIERKIGEMIRAINLERLYSKEEIMCLYLNNIYLSQNIYGVSSAAKYYFNKKLNELTLAECASIAAITQHPSKWDPILNPDNNKVRRNIILDEMYNQGYISSEECNESKKSEIVLDINKSDKENKITSWYTDAVIEEAKDLFVKHFGVTDSVALNMLYNGGYSIVTSMNENVQSILESYYSEKIFGDAQSAFVVIDPHNGQVLGLVGGTGKKEGSRILNRATDALNSPGSSIKPIAVYAPAFEKGIINYASIYDDTPFFFGSGDYDDLWPHNVNGSYKGLCTIEYAVSRSVNTVAVKILDEYGIGASFDFLQNKLGIDSLVEKEEHDGKIYTDLSLSSLALGGMTHGVTLLDMVSAYSIFPTEGVYREGICVLKIYDSDRNLIIDNTQRGKRVLSPQTAEVMNMLLSSVVNSVGGTASSSISRTVEYSAVAGKTGTTSGNYDRWFIGYSPTLVGGIYLGYDTPKSLSGIKSSRHIEVWDEVMAEIMKVYSKGEKSFGTDYLIETNYCMDSGKLVTDACLLDARGNRSAVGYFTKDNVPREYCDSHIKVKYCKDGMGVATPFCPSDSVFYVGMIKNDRTMPYNIVVRDSEYIYYPIDWEDESEIRKITVNRYLPFFDSLIDEGEYVGRGEEEYPFNRCCARHFIH